MGRLYKCCQSVVECASFSLPRFVLCSFVSVCMLPTKHIFLAFSWQKHPTLHVYLGSGNPNIRKSLQIEEKQQKMMEAHFSDSQKSGGGINSHLCMSYVNVFPTTKTMVHLRVCRCYAGDNGAGNKAFGLSITNPQTQEKAKKIATMVKQCATDWDFDVFQLTVLTNRRPIELL